MNVSEQPSDIPVLTATLYGASMSVLSLITLFGNGLVVLSFIKFKRLRTIPNYFIISLATADLLVPLLREAYVIVASFMRGWPFGEAWCKGSATCSYILCACSIAHLTCISLERMLCIKYPFYYNTHITSNKAIVIILILWLLSCVIGLFPQFGLGDILYNPQLIECEVNWNTRSRDKVLVSLLVIFFFVLPLGIMIASYGVIFSITRKQVRRISVLQTRFSSTSPLRREIKAVKTISVIVGVFFVMWLPYFLATICRVVTRKKVPADLLRLSLVLGYANSCCNWIVYTLMNRKLRVAFKRILRCKLTQVGPIDDCSLRQHKEG